jgi:F-type H+-transporting ATPase subunit a
MFGKKTFLAIGIVLLTLPQSARGASNSEEFNPGEMIFSHILDCHEWHIATVGQTHITVPLPILLIHDGKLHTFMSSKFHHGHSDYNRFRWMNEGEHKGKIVAVDSRGNISPKLPIDLSITKNVFSLLFSAIILFVMFLSISKAYKKRGTNQAPTGLQNAIEPVILFVRDDIAKPMIPAKYVDKYLPYLLTLFFFILFLNLLGLIPIFPGGASVTGNIAVTGALAVLTFIVTTFSGKRAYFQELVNYPGAPWWVKFPVPLMPMIEIMSMFIKPIVLMIRLMANMMAGHIIILGFVAIIFIFGKMNPMLGYGTSVLSVAFSLFVMLLELIVSFVQAFVFTLLSALYIGSALQDHHAEPVAKPCGCKGTCSCGIAEPIVNSKS